MNEKEKIRIILERAIAGQATQFELERVLKLFNKAKFLTPDEIEAMLWLPCCHVSGMHNPVHFQERKYICADQCKRALERFCVEIDIDPVTKSRKECSWCTDYKEKKFGEGLKLSSFKKK